MEAGLAVGGVKGDHLAAQGLHPLGKGGADAAGADEAHGAGGEAVDRHGLDVVPHPGLGHVADHIALAGEGHHEGQGLVGHLVGAVVGHVADLDAVGGGVLQVHVVHTHAVAHHELEGGDGLENLLVHPGVLVEEAHRPLALLDDLFLGLAVEPLEIVARGVENGLFGVHVLVVAVTDDDLRIIHTRRFLSSVRD